jgi:hypothetical protein
MRTHATVWRRRRPKDAGERHDGSQGGHSYTVSVKRGHTHWSGKATIRHGMIVSDECLSDAQIELSSPEFGKVPGRERMLMAIMQYPEPIEY